MNNYNNPSLPRKASGGIRARSESGEFARNWWAQRWIEAMERLVMRARLQRGQTYARMGQVLSMEETRNGVIAYVQGSRSKPYRVTIQVNPLNDRQWERLLDVLSQQAIFAAQLLAGEMPDQIEEAFHITGVSLFPTHLGDLKTECNCPDWANPCKHIAAAHYILGDRFDEDPFLLFRLRGRTQEQVIHGLLKRRAGNLTEISVEDEEAPEHEERLPALRECMDNFWNLSGSLEPLSIHVKPPEIQYPILKRLGRADFSEPIPIDELLGDAYDRVSQFALAIAFAGFDVGTAASEEEA